MARVTAVTWVQSLAWDLPHAMSVTKKKKKKKKSESIMPFSLVTKLSIALTVYRKQFKVLTGPSWPPEMFKSELLGYSWQTLNAFA